MSFKPWPEIPAKLIYKHPPFPCLQKYITTVNSVIQVVFTLKTKILLVTNMDSTFESM